MESSHGFCSVSVYFNWSIINFRKSLQLNVVAPHPILSFSIYVLVEVFFSTNDKLHKKLLFIFDVVHARLTNNIVIHLVPIVYLVRYSSEHAVAIPLNLSDLHPLIGHESAKCILLVFDLLDSIYNYLLLFLTHVSNLPLKLVSRLLILFYCMISLHLICQLPKLCVSECLRILAHFSIFNIQLLRLYGYVFVELGRPPLVMYFDKILIEINDVRLEPLASCIFNV